MGRLTLHVYYKSVKFIFQRIITHTPEKLTQIPNSVCLFIYMSVLLRVGWTDQGPWASCFTPLGGRLWAQYCQDETRQLSTVLHTLPPTSWSPMGKKPSLTVCLWVALPVSVFSVSTPPPNLLLPPATSPAQVFVVSASQDPLVLPVISIS